MVTDTMLREAAGEAESFLLARLSGDGRMPHQFSDQFEKNMDKLIRRVRHPVRHKLVRCAVATILVIITLFGAVFAASPQVRANVMDWVKGVFQEFFQYTSNDISDQTQYDYYLTTVPDGYRELNVVKKEDGELYLYVNESGQILQFTYAYGAMLDSIFIKVEEYEKYADVVNGMPADIYIATKENETSVVVWLDTEENVLFHICAKMDQSELIRLAASVDKKEK